MATKEQDEAAKKRYSRSYDECCWRQQDAIDAVIKLNKEEKLVGVNKW